MAIAPIHIQPKSLWYTSDPILMASSNTPTIGKCSSVLHAICTFLNANASPQKKYKKSIYENVPIGVTNTASNLTGVANICPKNLNTFFLPVVCLQSRYISIRRGTTSNTPMFLVNPAPIIKKPARRNCFFFIK